MKKLFIIFAAGVLFASCGGETKTNTETADTTSADGTEVASTDSVAADSLTATDKPASVSPEKKEQPEKAEQPEKPEKAEKPEKPQAVVTGSVKGGELIKASDCLSCHKEDTKLVGPAYADVAKKYKPTAANIDMLADKVIAGGSGNWGQIPMSPHPNVSKNDAKEMVKYILAVK